MNSFFKNHFDSFAFKNICREFEDSFPHLKVECVGKSVMGKEIFAFIPVKASQYTLVIGGVAGNECFSVEFLTRFVQNLSLRIQKETLALRFNPTRSFKRGVIVVPCLNPDGCEIASLGKSATQDKEIFISSLCGGDFSAFRLNARGTNLYSSLFTSPSAEPETAAVRSLFDVYNIKNTVILGGETSPKEADDHSRIKTERSPDIAGKPCVKILTSSSEKALCDRLFPFFLT